MYHISMNPLHFLQEDGDGYQTNVEEAAKHENPDAFIMIWFIKFAVLIIFKGIKLNF